jgi:hypothetical protein
MNLEKRVKVFLKICNDSIENLPKENKDFFMESLNIFFKFCYGDKWCPTYLEHREIASLFVPVVFADISYLNDNMFKVKTLENDFNKLSKIQSEIVSISNNFGSFWFKEGDASPVNGDLKNYISNKLRKVNFLLGEIKDIPEILRGGKVEAFPKNSGGKPPEYNRDFRILTVAELFIQIIKKSGVQLKILPASDLMDADCISSIKKISPLDRYILNLTTNFCCVLSFASKLNDKTVYKVMEKKYTWRDLTILEEIDKMKI